MLKMNSSSWHMNNCHSNLHTHYITTSTKKYFIEILKRILQNFYKISKNSLMNTTYMMVLVTYLNYHIVFAGNILLLVNSTITIAIR